MSRVWGRLLGVELTTVLRVELEEATSTLVAHVRPHGGRRGRCGVCQQRCPGYDQGAGRRRWRALDAGTVMVEIEADAPRVSCPTHGVVVAHVPWARHGAGHTRFFDEQVAWLTVRTSKTAVTALMRIAWRTVGAIVDRVCADIDAGTDRLAGLRRISIDEISHRKGHHYIVVVVDLDTGRLVWARPGRDQATVAAFFTDLGAQRCAELTHIAADAADWIFTAAYTACPQAAYGIDPFHVVQWATKALDALRRRVWNEARKLAASEAKAVRGNSRGPRPERPLAKRAEALKHTRWALLKNPQNLTSHQQAKLTWIAANDTRLHQAYLLKEGLRLVFALDGEEALHALNAWIPAALDSDIEEMIKVGRSVANHRHGIETSLRENLSSALSESTNTKIRLLQRIAYGFHGPEPLIALAKLALGHPRPALPGRT